MKLKDLTGKNFGRLTVTKRLENKILPSGKSQTRWLCKCECGNQHIASGENLKSGNVESCGCYAKEIQIKTHIKHGMSRTRIFNEWRSMKKRCTNKSRKDYKHYGDRGIKVCDEWFEDFMSFYNWAMANGYKDNLTLDRKNVNGNYEPDNCRWITNKEQQSNRRSNRILVYNGEALTITKMADKYHISRYALAYRLNKGMDIEKALFTPVDKGNNFLKTANL
jgi:hypothetical protein